MSSRPQCKIFCCSYRWSITHRAEGHLPPSLPPSALLSLKVSSFSSRWGAPLVVWEFSQCRRGGFGKRDFTCVRIVKPTGKFIICDFGRYEIDLTKWITECLRGRHVWSSLNPFWTTNRELKEDLFFLVRRNIFLFEKAFISSLINEIVRSCLMIFIYCSVSSF